MALPSTPKLDMYFGPEATSDVCRSLVSAHDRVNGCTSGLGTSVEVAAADYFVIHEFVHAVRATGDQRAPAVFEEGIAELLAGAPGFPAVIDRPRGTPWLGPEQLLQVPNSQFTGEYYPPAASFMSWLWDSFGRKSVSGFLEELTHDDQPGAAASFRTHFGISLAEAEQMWRDDPSPPQTYGTPCIEGRTYTLDDNPLILTGSLDCESDDVLGVGLGMDVLPMCLELERNTRVRVEVDADAGALQLLLREQCQPATSATPQSYQDKRIEAGESVELDMAGCRWRVLFGTDDQQPTPYRIALSNANP
ncbi:MAG: hypothetical protein K0V04_25485 [Deltaproteobacteria bacterium]|nr:hypothetical protein [Deltaproteobacteria bacterium]